MRKIFTLFFLLVLTALGTAQAQNLKVDFEQPLDNYTDWVFTNMARNTTRGVNGTAAGINAKTDNTNGTTGSKMITTAIIAKPKTLKLQYAKLSRNTNASSYLQVYVERENGDTTHVVAGKSNAQLTAQDTYEELVADLSTYTSVKVCIEFKGTSALRAIDNVELSIAGDVNKQSQSLSFFIKNFNLVMGSYEFSTFRPIDVQGAMTPVTYTTSDEEIAMVNANTGDITFGGKAGVVTITATAAETDQYYSASASYTINVQVPFDNIKQANLHALGLANNTKENHTLSFNNAVVTYATTNSAFIQDATGAIMLYLNDHDFKAGQTLNGSASIILTNYNGLPELTYINKSQLMVNQDVEPDPITADLAKLKATDNATKAQYLSTYVTFDDVAVVTEVKAPSQAGKPYTIIVEFNEGMLDVRVNDGSMAINPGDILKLKGLVSIYKDALQLATYAPEHLVRVVPLTLNEAQMQDKKVYMATYYNEDDNVIIPANAYTATIIETHVKPNLFLNKGEVLNAKTPVIFISDEAFDGYMEVTTKINSKDTPENVLRGAADDETISEEGMRNYVLTPNAETNELGFFFDDDAPAGDKLENIAGEAYIAVAAAQAPENGFTFGETITAIDAPALEKAAPLYDLSGRRVNRTAKGIFIQNGQKVVR